VRLIGAVKLQHQPMDKYPDHRSRVGWISRRFRFRLWIRLPSIWPLRECLKGTESTRDLCIAAARTAPNERSKIQIGMASPLNITAHGIA
jgi:hypothetical protein